MAILGGCKKGPKTEKSGKKAPKSDKMPKRGVFGVNYMRPV